MPRKMSELLYNRIGTSVDLTEVLELEHRLLEISLLEYSGDVNFKEP